MYLCAFYTSWSGFNDWLKVKVRNGAIWSAAFFSILVGTRSGPVALEASSFLRRMPTPFTVICRGAISGVLLAPRLGIELWSSSVNRLSYC